jgi:hypothetical protein
MRSFVANGFAYSAVCHPASSTATALHPAASDPLRVLPAGARVAGWGLHPRHLCTLARHAMEPDRASAVRLITQNWRGKPLVSHQVIIQLIANTTTDTGLTVAWLDNTTYEKGIKVSDAEMAALNIQTCQLPRRLELYLRSKMAR